MTRKLTKTSRMTFAELGQRVTESPHCSSPGTGKFEIKRGLRPGETHWRYRRRSAAGLPQNSAADHGSKGDDVGVGADRSRLVAELRNAKLPRPSAEIGEILAALSACGLFSRGAVVVDHTAYQTYSGLLGARLKEPKGTRCPARRMRPP